MKIFRNWSFQAFNAKMKDGRLTLRTHSKTRLIINPLVFAGELPDGKILCVTVELEDDEDEVMKQCGPGRWYDER